MQISYTYWLLSVIRNHPSITETKIQSKISWDIKIISYRLTVNSKLYSAILISKLSGRALVRIGPTLKLVYLFLLFQGLDLIK